jgi:endonuclease/exonuclease/phosphatase (EEP) superfamily protein YafD
MLKKFLFAFGLIAIILTITPYIPLDYWWIRVFDFPHTQLTILTSIAIATYFIRFDFNNKKDYVFVFILMFCCGFQFIKIYPYTAFADVEVLNSSKSSENTLKILTANVLQENKKSDLLIAEINTLKPDLILLTEVNQRWLNQLNETTNKMFKYKHEIPLDNAYGMALYSNLELKNTETKFLVSDSIPSIETELLSKSGDLIQLFAIHPTPPIPHQNTMSTNRDAEMMMIAKKSMEAKLPVIVLGDFNDVAWSETSKLFSRVSRLLDSRIGRGMFNTFSAESYIMKWPLDHIFISSEFRLKKIEVRESISSDHYPLYTEFTFEPDIANEQQPEQVSEEDLKAANNQIKKYIESEKTENSKKSNN